MHRERRPTLLLADDHPLLLDGVRHLVETHYDVVGTVADGKALVAAAERLKPDLIVADISMPGMNGLAAAQISSRIPAVTSADSRMSLSSSGDL